MTTRIMECIKSFKYGGKILQVGEEFVPQGGKWDHVLSDPEKGYIRIVSDQKPAQKAGTKKKPKATDKFVCSCGREFETERGLKTHARYCKGDK